MLFVPGKKEFAKFMIINCVSVWWVGNPYIDLGWWHSRITRSSYGIAMAIGGMNSVKPRRFESCQTIPSEVIKCVKRLVQKCHSNFFTRLDRAVVVTRERSELPMGLERAF